MNNSATRTVNVSDEKGCYRYDNRQNKEHHTSSTSAIADHQLAATTISPVIAHAAMGMQFHQAA